MFSDKQLQDYLAGTLPPEDATALELAIAQDETLEARLFAFDFAQAAPLRDAFEQVPDAARMQNLEELIVAENAASIVAIPPAPRVSWKWSAVAAVAAFAIGGFLFSGQTGEVDISWKNQVAIYQALYVEDTLASTIATQEDLTEQLARSEQAVGRTLPLDVVGDLDGMQLLRAQILGYEGTPLIQMAYLSEGGVPVALCAIRLTNPTTNQPTFETLSGLPSVHWSDGTYGYMIVGDIERDRLENLADNISKAL